jgi:hypothetical protein
MSKFEILIVFYETLHFKSTSRKEKQASAVDHNKCGFLILLRTEENSPTLEWEKWCAEGNS